jgi:hypothetical protein
VLNQEPIGQDVFMQRTPEINTNISSITNMKRSNRQLMREAKDTMENFEDIDYIESNYTFYASYNSLYTAELILYNTELALLGLQKDPEVY